MTVLEERLKFVRAVIDGFTLIELDVEKRPRVSVADVDAAIHRVFTNLGYALVPPENDNPSQEKLPTPDDLDRSVGIIIEAGDPDDNTPF